MIKEEIYSKVYTKVLNFLSYKQRSRYEIEKRLKKYLDKVKSISKKEIDEIYCEVLDQIEKDGYIDDKYFTQTYLNTQRNSPKSKSVMQLRQFLLKKGISRELIQTELENIDDDFEIESIKKAAKKKLNQLKDKRDIVRKQKLLKFLVRKGYKYQNVYSVVDSLIDVK